MFQNTIETLALFQALGGWEIALILVAALLLFGGKKLPELARGLGKGMRQFKEELTGAKKSLDDISKAVDDDVESPAAEENENSGESDNAVEPEEDSASAKS